MRVAHGGGWAALVEACGGLHSCDLMSEHRGLSGQGRAALSAGGASVLRAQHICSWERLVVTESWELEDVPMQ